MYSNKWINKRKIGLFKIFELNSKNNYSVNLSNEFKNYQKYKYSIISFPVINSLNIPEYFLGYRYEEDMTEKYTYSIKLYLKYIESKIFENQIYTLRYMYNGVDTYFYSNPQNCNYTIPFPMLSYNISLKKFIHIGMDRFCLFSVKNDIVFSKNAIKSNIVKIEINKILRNFDYLDFYFRDNKVVRLNKDKLFFYIDDVLNINEDSFLVLNIKDSKANEDFYDYCIIRFYYKDGFFRDVTLYSRGKKLTYKSEDFVGYSKIMIPYICYYDSSGIHLKHNFIGKHNCYIKEFFGKFHYYGDDFSKIFPYNTNNDIVISLVPTYIENLTKGNLDEEYKYFSLYANEDVDWHRYLYGGASSYIMNAPYYYKESQWLRETYIAGYNFEKLQYKNISQIYKTYGSSTFNSLILENLKLNNNYGFPFIFLLIPGAVNSHASYNVFDSPPSFNIAFGKIKENVSKDSSINVGIMEVID